MRFASAMQMKGWIKNLSAQTGTHANTLLQNYMLERFLERLSLSPYRGNFVIKGGFLIAAMVGVDRRSTMDLDATVKGLPLSFETIGDIMQNIVSIYAGDGVSLDVLGVESIHDRSEYNDFRVSISASLYTVHVSIKIDITTGDSIVPHEVEYGYKLMFDERAIPIMAYSPCAILAEKIETILARGVGNTRGRDFYDAHLLLSMNKDKLPRPELLRAIEAKAAERGSTAAIDNHSKILGDIAASPSIEKIWDSYRKRYPYAKDIAMQEIIRSLEWVFEEWGSHGG